MLNTKQLEVYNEVLNGKNKIIILIGAGGTGKTYTTAQIVKDYKGTVALTATTNKAKDVIANIANYTANTTQSQLGFAMVRGGKNEWLHQVKAPEVADLVIVEEVSMLTKNVFNTLMEELSNGNIKKVLLLGDPIQLPAIGLGVKLSEVKGVVYELTEQVRQKDNTEVIEYLETLRKAIESTDKAFDFLRGSTNSSNIFITDNHLDFSNAYHKSEGIKKILAYSNKVIDKYNLHIHGGSFKVGDEVIIPKPLGKCKNGDTVLILDVIEFDNYYYLSVSANGQIFDIRHYKSNAKLDADRDKAPDYWDFTDKCYNLKHQYACTIHKAQGSTYDNVFIDGSDLIAQLNKTPSKWNNYSKPMDFNYFLRLMYVALSRLRVSAHIYIGDTRNYSYFRKDNAE